MIVMVVVVTTVIVVIDVIVVHQTAVDALLPRIVAATMIVVDAPLLLAVTMIVVDALLRLTVTDATSAPILTPAEMIAVIPSMVVAVILIAMMSAEMNALETIVPREMIDEVTTVTTNAISAKLFGKFARALPPHPSSIFSLLH